MNSRRLFLAPLALLAPCLGACGGCPASAVATIVVTFAPGVELPDRVQVVAHVDPSFDASLDCVPFEPGGTERSWLCACRPGPLPREFTCEGAAKSDRCDLVFTFDDVATPVCLDDPTACNESIEYYRVEDDLVPRG